MAIETTSDLSLVGTSQIVDGSVTSSKIGAGAVVAASIAAAAVGSAAISAGSINSTHIGANSVVSGDIAAGAVDSAALASGSVVAASIAAGAVGSAALASNAVVAAKIAALSVGVVAISSGTSTSGTLLTADGAGGAAFSPAPPGGGMVLISSVSAFASASPTASLGFTNIPQTYTRLHLIGQFYVTSAGEYQIGINPSTVTNSIGGTTGFAGQIYYISKTSDNGVTTYGTGLNNMEGTGGGTFYCTIPNMNSRWSNVVVDISNPRTLGPTSRLGFIAQHNAGRFVGHSWGYSEAGGPLRTLWVSGSFHVAIFSLYGS
jgi:hypothetical protein